MRTPVFHFAFFAWLSLILSPLTVAHASSSPADSVHFCVFDDYEKWRRDHPRPAAKRRAGLNVGEPRTVRMIYFLPNDRPYRAEAVERIKEDMYKAQTFFAEQMQAHGYGNKTFRFETDAQGEPLVHHVDGKHPDSYYAFDPKAGWDTLLRREIGAAFDLNENIYVVYKDVTYHQYAAHRFTKNSGFAELTARPERRLGFWTTLAHELGHAFGLPHDYRDGAYILSYGGPSQFPDAEGRDRISACAAEFLFVHPYFNSAIPIKESSLPTVELVAPITGENLKPGSGANYPAGLESMSLQFEVSDTDGLSRVLLHAHPNNGYGGLRECRALDGEREAVIAFDYDGSSMAADPARAVTSLSDSYHLIILTVVDTVGDIAILHHSQDDPQMDADGRRIVETRRSASRIVQSFRIAI